MADAKREELPADKPQTHPLDALTNPVETSVEHLIDKRIRDFVQAGFKMCQDKPRKWFHVKLTETDVRNVAREAKAYAREAGLAFRQKKVTDPTMLVYRVVQPAPKQAEK